MLRTFTSEALDAMCKTRPEGYRQDILSIALAVAGQPGVYQVDTDSKAYTDIVRKYSTRKVPEGVPPAPKVQRGTSPHELLSPRPMTPQATVVSRNMMELRMDAILAAVGQASVFGDACAAYNAAKLRGGCTGCRKGGQLERLLAAFKRTVLTADMDTKRAARNLFQDTQYLELRPVTIKWSDLIADPKEKENAPA